MDFAFDVMAPDQFAAALRENSAVILRGAVAPARLSWFQDDVVLPTAEDWRARTPEGDDEAWCQLFANTGCVAERMSCVAERMIRRTTSGRYSLYDLIADPRLWSLLAAVGAPLSPSVQAHTRSIHPTVALESREGVRFSTPVPVHYDRAVHKEALLCLNVWCPFTAVGIRAGAPTLRILRQPQREAIAWLRAGGVERDLPYPETTMEGIAALFPGSSILPLELEAGDVAVFTNWTIHQTCITPTMTRGRTSAEIRLQAGDAAFEAMHS